MTVEREVQITFWKVKVLSDGDKGRAPGSTAVSTGLVENVPERTDVRPDESVAETAIR